MIRITVREEGISTEKCFADTIDVEGLLRTLGKLPDANIAFRGGVPIPLTERLNDGDSVTIIRVASGG